MVDLEDSGVKSSNAPENQKLGHVTHPQIGFVDEVLGKMHLARLGTGLASRPNVEETDDEDDASQSRHDLRALPLRPLPTHSH